MTMPSRHWVELPDARLEAAWWGPGPAAAPTIALLHEGLGCVALWREFPAAVAAATGCGVLAWSRIGYGVSSPVRLPRPVSYMHDEARKYVSPVLDALGVRCCLLLGHSDGASIATIHAGSLADARVAALVLLAPHFVVEPVSLAGIRTARQRWETTDLRAKLARYHHDVDGAFLGWNDAWSNEAFHDWSITAELARVQVPILVVQGTADPYGSVAQLRLAEGLAPGRVESLVLQGVGHAPQAEAPEAVLAAISDFTARAFNAAK